MLPAQFQSIFATTCLPPRTSALLQGEEQGSMSPLLQKNGRAAFRGYPAASTTLGVSSISWWLGAVGVEASLSSRSCRGLKHPLAVSEAASTKQRR